ncbi:MAG: aminopeptidase P family protein [Paracoccaceae bacterium]|jgi:Xaa-Pro aminopeptidase|nr:aminopeptidase P family protein [Paracoccaceae bacterium]
MFQSFENLTRPEQGPPRLKALREAMVAEGVDAFLVPRADAHQGEYVAPRDDRLAWLTGFTGSAGFCAVLADQAGLFVDGRYTLQAGQQVDTAALTLVPWPQTKLADWLSERLPGGGTVGFDPWLHTVKEIADLRAKGESHGLTYCECSNLVDSIWPDQPAPPRGAFRIHPDALAGESHHGKRARLAEDLAQAGHGAAVLTSPDSIAWLLNIRGSDIRCNPVPHAFALLHETGAVELFADPAKVTGEVRAHLGGEVALHPPKAFTTRLAELTGPVRIDPATAPVAVERALPEPVHGPDPCLLPKARKTAAEIAGMEAAHLRDAAAMCRFLAWLEGAAPTGTLTEIDIVTRLEEERRRAPELLEISFDTICGAGPHGAIVHYRVTAATNATVTPGELLLIDSGGQYVDGTTDITRTVATGPVTRAQRAAFTQVLKGLIAIHRARWPRGLAGRDLDALARIALWRVGRDYDHGTGHGVGAALSVHEGPQRLSRVSDVALEPGMVLSNEPGYYRAGEWGIRLENLVHVVPAPAVEGGDAREMLAVANLTWVPIDRRLIDRGLLDRDEAAWCDAYHGEIRTRVGPLVEGAAADWLARATAPL